MTVSDNGTSGSADGDDFVEAVHAPGPAPSHEHFSSGERKKHFFAWHHPIKQIVRQRQWSDLTYELIDKDRTADQRSTLRYFTLPGSDLLDVRVLAESLTAFDTKIEYFGFNAGNGTGETATPGASFTAESALRQAGLISDGSLVLRDRLEDIALPGSQAQSQLSQQAPFDVINIDACDHLGFKPKRRDRSTFDALEQLLGHQLAHRKPWLLFITTRADPSILGPHFTKMQSSINENLAHHEAEFGPALATSLGVDLVNIVPEINKAWAGWSENFLKIYSVGLGKYLLHYFHAQRPVAADVELKSVYAYRVKNSRPDMLSFAFRVVPKAIQPQKASIGGAQVHDLMEAKSGVRIANRASKLWLLDDAIAAQESLRDGAVKASAKLLAAANYDLDSWTIWLRDHDIRPMVVTSDQFI